MLSNDIVRPEEFACFAKRRLSHADASEIFDYVANRLPVDPARITLKVIPNNLMPEEAIGLYEQRLTEGNPSQISNIYLAESELDEFLSTVTTLAHEVAHEALLGNGLLTRDEQDHEFLTDLLPIFFGFGLFLANNTIRESNWNDGLDEFSASSRKGYLSSQTMGHALAIYSWLKNDTNPDWHSALRLDAGKTLSACLRYFRKTHDCLVTPDTVHQVQSNRQTATATTIDKKSPTYRIAAVWDLDESSESIAVAARLLHDDELEIRRETLGYFENIDDLSPVAVEALTESLTDPDEWCQALAAWTLVRNGIASQPLADSLSWLLAHDDSSYSWAVQSAVSLLVKNDDSLLADDRAVDAMIRTVVRDLWSDFGKVPTSECEFEKRGFDQSVQLLQPAIKAIPNLAGVLKERFPKLSADDACGILELATMEMVTQKE